MSNIIGIDVGKMSLDCAWLRDLDQDKPKRKKVENSPQGFKSMLTWAQDVSGLAASELSFMVEPTGIYHEFLVQFLDQRQATIYLVNPSMVRKFAAGMGILSKNDLIDADMLTRYGLPGNCSLTSLKPRRSVTSKACSTGSIRLSEI